MDVTLVFHLEGVFRALFSAFIGTGEGDAGREDEVVVVRAFGGVLVLRNVY